MTSEQRKRAFALTACAVVYQEGTDLPLPGFLSPQNSAVFVASAIENEISLSAFVRPQIADSSVEAGFVPQLPFDLLPVDKAGKACILENICCANGLAVQRMSNSVRAMDAAIGKLLVLEDKTIVSRLHCFVFAFLIVAVFSRQPL